MSAHLTPEQIDRLHEFSMQDRYQPSIRRSGTNDEYAAQDVPYATFPSPPGVVFRAGTEVGGRICPRCPSFIAVTSRVVRLRRKEAGRWWVHERCAEEGEVIR